MQSSSKFKVVLNLYDISGGLARQMSRPLIGMQIDYIPHTGIVVYGREYFYGGGICTEMPKATPFGKPIQEIHLGDTEIPHDVFVDFLKDIRGDFTMEKYDLFTHNCNHFTDTCAKFLLDKGIPDNIVNLPQQVLATPLGQMIKPIADGMRNSLIQQSHPLFNASGIVNPEERDPRRAIIEPTPNLSGFTATAPAPAPAPVQAKPVAGGPETAIELNSLEQFVEVMEKDEVCIFDCFSYTCPPCMRIKPIYEAMAKEYTAKHPEIKFYKVNTQAGGREIAETFEVRAIPCFLAFHKGALVDRFEGANEPKLRVTIESLVSKIQKKPTFQLFNPEKKDFYRFTDKFDSVIAKLKTLLTTSTALKDRNNAIFDKFATNPSQNAKSFTLAEKKELLKWVLEVLDPVNAEVEPFWELWSLLFTEDPWMAIYCHVHGAHIDKTVSELNTKDKEITKNTRICIFRAWSNLFNVHEGRHYMKKFFAPINDLVLASLPRYKEDKATLAALVWLAYNISVMQNDIGLKDGDATRYLEAMCEIIATEKDENVLQGAFRTITTLSYEKAPRIQLVQSKKLGTVVESHSRAENKFLKSAVNDFRVVVKE